MSSTTFLQFNPDENNQENDAAWEADSLRTGGIPVDAILPSPFLNKIWYQSAIMATALATAVANILGASVTDADLATLVAQIQKAFQIGAINTPNVVAFSPTMEFDASISSVQETTLTGNASAPTIVNQLPGQVLIFILHQDSTGGRTFTWPTSPIIYPGPAINAGALSTTVLAFIMDSSNVVHPFTPAVVG